MPAAENLHPTPALAALSWDMTGGGTARLAWSPNHRGENENSAELGSVPVARSWIYGVRQGLHIHSQGFSPCLVFRNRAQGSPVPGDAEIPTGSGDAENTNQLSGTLVYAPLV